MKNILSFFYAVIAMNQMMQAFFFPFSFFELKLCCVECCCEKSPLFKLNAVLL